MDCNLYRLVSAIKAPEVKTVVTAFDNGDARGMEQPAMPSMKYSRGVEYQIDEKKYDGFPNVGICEARFDWYSAIASVTEYRRKPNDVACTRLQQNERYKTDRFRSGW